ncbi:MAG: hypothetical protein EXQ86_11910 [Rhodospirillales bacterium]|nr:hypothetical protein [Rhodospirillales bacterium]
MHEFSEWYGIGYGVGIIIWLVVIVWPVARILGRAGFSRWWVLLTFVPLVNIVALWVFAYTRWPSHDRG